MANQDFFILGGNSHHYLLFNSSFHSTSYGTEKIKEYFFDDSLTYQSAKVEPSLLGVSVKLENFSYSSAVLFEGEEIELELNLLNSVISQRLHLEMLAFKMVKLHPMRILKVIKKTLQIFL